VIRHVVLLRWKEGTTTEQHQAVLDALHELPGLIPEIVRYRIGADLGLAEGNAHVSVIADFATEDDWRTYTGHPDHVRVITELIRPHLETRAASQYEFDPAADA